MDSKTLGIIGASFLGGALTASIAYKLLHRNPNPNPATNPVPSNLPPHPSVPQTHSYAQDPQYQQIKQQQLARIIKFFGEEKFQKMQNSFVVVFGVGGVGSHVVNMLARSGVRRIRIVDFDTVSMSSLNRHSFAVREDVGTLKVDCIKKYIHKIFPHIIIQPINTYATPQNIRTLLHPNLQQVLSCLQSKTYLTSPQSPDQPHPDYIIDCIDNLDAKVELIGACLESKLRLIVSGGAGMKSDPTKLQVRDISDCKYDKLIMRIKRELTKREIKSGVKVVFSYQQPQKQLLPLTQPQQQDPQAYKVFDNYRIRIVPVLGTMPAIIGMAIASYVLCQLAGQPYEPFQTDYVKSSAMGKLFNELLYEVRKRGCDVGTYLLVDVEEVAILAKKVYNWRCLVQPGRKGERLAIWDRNKPASIQNLTLMTKQNYQKHFKAKSLQDLHYPQDVVRRFQQKAKQAKKLMQSGFMMFT